MATSHSRNASTETNATSASTSYDMILEHVLQYPRSYEIPLRTMFTLNCAPRAQPLPSNLSRAPSPTSATASPVPNLACNDAEATAMSFSNQLMNHIAQTPPHTKSLPPVFIVSFVSRVFHPAISLVDFDQALPALDYLCDLEKRRCREYVAALTRLGIRVEHFESDVAAIAERYPGIALWANNMHAKNTKAEHHYKFLYIGLRRWIMINEMSLKSFNKRSCMAMLNTLLPPQSPSGTSKVSTPLLDPEFLREERQAFFEYLQDVAREGPECLRPIIELNKGPGDETGWDRLQKTVDKYLRVAKSMIDDCTATTGVGNFTAVDDARKGKKTDSGVSFGSEQRPSTASSSLEKPLPAAPSDFNPQATKGLSKIERITREFKRMRKSRIDVEEIVKVNQYGDAPPPVDGESKGKKSLKKARSLANLAHLKSSNGSLASLVSRKESNATQFDPEEMKRARLVYEASTTTKGSKNLV